MHNVFISCIPTQLECLYIIMKPSMNAPAMVPVMFSLNICTTVNFEDQHTFQDFSQYRETLKIKDLYKKNRCHISKNL